MLRASLKKIKSAHNPQTLIILGGAFILVLLLLVSLVLYGFNDGTGKPDRLSAGGHQYILEPVATVEEQAKGLGQRAGLPRDRGMIFIYPAEQRLCFWMKDMQFPIDMIWVSTDKRVAAVEADVAPDTYPRAYCHTGRYVIELNAGEADRAQLQAGQQLHF
jgi:uncharacterized membrane protein (UPF0127 family)